MKFDINNTSKNNIFLLIALIIITVNKCCVNILVLVVMFGV